MTAAKESVEQAATSVTAYVILRFSGEGGDQLPPKYELVARDVGARSAEAAIRKHAERAKENERDGLYVAIPARSWKPTKITTKVERTLVVEEA